jgi:hypothetical protein
MLHVCTLALDQEGPTLQSQSHKELRLKREFQERAKQQILGVLVNEGAADLSNTEIEAALKGCVLSDKLTALAKEYRDTGFLTVSEFRQLKRGAALAPSQELARRRVLWGLA